MYKENSKNNTYMKFVVSSTSLLTHLQAVGKVIGPKSTMPILDCIVFDVTKKSIKLTASDLEITLTTKLEPESVEHGGKIAIPARIILEIIKKFPEQPLTFEVDKDSYSIKIMSSNGEYSLVGCDADEFPQTESDAEESAVKLKSNCGLVLDGISKTLFATGNDEIRLVMNCILVELMNDSINFVASDAHKLVRYKRFDAKGDTENQSFILPKKPASLLKQILPKKEDETIKIEFSSKKAQFEFGTYKLSCKLIEGKFPNYNSVIPQNNPNKLIIDREMLLNSINRVSVVANPASNQIKLELSNNKIEISAQDIDFSTSGHEVLECQYEGAQMAIGFKSSFLSEIISNITSSNIIVELSDPVRPGLFLPYDNDNADEDVLMMLMPMMIN